jgi:hypothetical protein
MELFSALFTTREQAMIVWIVIFVIWSFFQKNLHKSFHGLLQAFFQKKIFIAFILMLIYVGLVLYLLSQAHLWNTDLLKDTIFWVIGTAFVLFFSLNRAVEDKGYFKKIISDNLKFILILTFLINFFTFSMVVELILLPILILVAAMSAYAEIKKEYLPVKKFTNFLLSVWGIFLVIYITIKVLKDYQNLLASDNLLAFLLPLLLTFILLPFLYGSAVYMVYENLFTKIDFLIGRKNRQLAKLAKHKIFMVFTLNLQRLARFSRNSGGQLLRIANEKDLTRLIKQF